MTTSETKTKDETVPKMQAAMFGDDDLQASYYRISIKETQTSVIKSAMQKAIRRGEVRVATMCAAMMLASHHVANLYNRLLVIASEDIGPADDRVIEFVTAMFKKYKQKRKALGVEWRNLRNDVDTRDEVDSIVRTLCASPKTRAVDHACIAHVCKTFEYDVNPPDAKVEWMTESIKHATSGRLVEALEALGCALRVSGVSSVMKSLEGAGAVAAVAAAREIVTAKRAKGARPPLIHLTHGVFMVSNMGDHPDAKLPVVPPDTLELYKLLTGPDKIPDIPDYAFDLHVTGNKGDDNDTVKFVAGEHAALNPRVDPDKVKFPEIALYEAAKGPGAEARDKLAARKARIAQLLREDKKKERAAKEKKKKEKAADSKAKAKDKKKEKATEAKAKENAKVKPKGKGERCESDSNESETEHEDDKRKQKQKVDKKRKSEARSKDTKPRKKRAISSSEDESESCSGSESD